MPKEYLTHKQACEAMEAGAFIREVGNGCLYWSEILHTPYGNDRYIFYLDENGIAQTTSFDPTWDDELDQFEIFITDNGGAK